MLTLKKLLGAVQVAENNQTLIVTSFLLSERTFRFLKFTQSLLEEYSLGSIYIESEYGDEISLTESFDDVHNGVSGKLKITKSADTPIFFDESYFKKALKSSTLLQPVYKLIYEAGDFKTKEVIFLGREGIRKYRADTASNASVEISNKYVVSLNQEAINFLPVSIDQWLVNQHGSIPGYWKVIAAPKLLVTIASEVLLLGNELQAVFKGDRRIKLTLDTSNEQLVSSMYTSVNTIAVWIYSEGRDIETRHHVFNNQVCQLSLNEVDNFMNNFNGIADRVLENAILAYRYYVQSSNKELSKSLTEINKTLFEHLNKIRQNTVDLVNSLWRDFTTAFGLMILNFSLKQPDVSHNYWSLLLVGLIVYLCVSYYLSSSVGFWFYYRLKQSLSEMRTRIYGYLTDEDFNNFATTPLRAAQKKFIRTFWLVLGCYLAIISMVVFALRSGKPSVSKPSITLVKIIK